MPTPDELAEQLRDLAEKVDALDDEPTPGEPTDPPAGVPAKPTGLACVIGPDGRPVLTWDDPGGVDSWDVLDLANSAQSVKETVTVPRSVRSPVKPGTPARRYAVRARNAAGLSEVSDSVDVPATGGTTPDPPTPQIPSTGRYPSDVLPVLKTWTVTTTTGKQGSPFNNYLVGQEIPGVFYVRDDGGVMHHATVNGVHTKNSHRCRVEGRQMADANWTKAAWNGNDPHAMEAELWASTAGLTKRKRVSALQIHDGADDVLQVVADAELGLALVSDDGKTVNVLDPDYRDEQRFTCRIETGGGKIRVTYNGTKTVELSKTGKGWYFKAGSYVQASMEEHGEPPTAFAEVCVYRLDVTGAPLS